MLYRICICAFLKTSVCTLWVSELYFVIKKYSCLQFLTGGCLLECSRLSPIHTRREDARQRVHWFGLSKWTGGPPSRKRWPAYRLRNHHHLLTDVLTCTPAISGTLLSPRKDGTGASGRSMILGEETRESFRRNDQDANVRLLATNSRTQRQESITALPAMSPCSSII